MKIAAHITFYNHPNSQFGYSQNRYLVATVEGLRESGATVFIHTNRAADFSWLPWVCPDSRVIVHDLKGIHGFYLAAMSRSVIYDTYKDFDHTIYIEDDIRFGRVNLDYYLRHHEFALRNGGCISFQRCVRGRDDDNLYFMDMVPLVKDRLRPVDVSGRQYLVSGGQNYCAMWIMDRDELGSFIRKNADQFWLKHDLPFKSWYLIRENAAYGPINVLYGEGKILYADQPGMLIEHMPWRGSPTKTENNKDGLATVRVDSMLHHDVSYITEKSAI